MNCVADLSLIKRVAFISHELFNLETDSGPFMFFFVVICYRDRYEMPEIPGPQTKVGHQAADQSRSGRPRLGCAKALQHVCGTHAYTHTYTPKATTAQNRQRKKKHVRVPGSSRWEVSLQRQGRSKCGAGNLATFRERERKNFVSVL